MKGKKILLSLAAFGLLAGLVGCNSNEQKSEESKQSEQSQQPASSAQPSSEAEPVSSQQDTSTVEPESSEQAPSSQASSAKQSKITVAGADGVKKITGLGQTLQLTASADNETLAGVTWESKNTAVATVDQNGLVTSVSKGSAQITANKEGYKEGVIAITVELVKINVTAANDDTELLVGETVQLSADQQNVEWKTSDATVATVSDTGLVTAHKLGNATISAEKENYATGSLTINVVRPEPTAVLGFEDADHEAADGWWGTAAEGYSPVYARDSGNASGNQCIAHLDAGDKEVLSFTSTAAVKAELVIMMASSSSIEDMSAVMSAKFNTADVAVPAVAFTTGSNSEFAEFSLGEVDLLVGDNALELDFLASAPYIDDLKIYANATTVIALKEAPAKETIEVSTPTLTINRGETAQINVTKPTDLTGVNFVSDNEEMATVSATGLVSGEALGDANVTISKAGMISIRIAVTITDQPVEGEIRIEAEDQADDFDWSSLGFHKYTDRTSGIAFGHSGSAYITGYDVNSEISLTYTVPSEEAQTMLLVIAAAPHYQMQAGEEYVFGVDATILLNDVEVNVNDGAKVVGDGARMGAKTQNVTIGTVSLNQGDNTFVIQFHGKAPALDCFKFMPLH